jgi:hypothetical protein
MIAIIMNMRKNQTSMIMTKTMIKKREEKQGEKTGGMTTINQVF